MNNLVNINDHILMYLNISGDILYVKFLVNIYHMYLHINDHKVIFLNKVLDILFLKDMKINSIQYNYYDCIS